MNILKLSRSPSYSNHSKPQRSAAWDLRKLYQPNIIGVYYGLQACLSPLRNTISSHIYNFLKTVSWCIPMRELPRDLNQSDIIYSGPKMNFPLHVSDTVKSENFSKFFFACICSVRNLIWWYWFKKEYCIGIAFQTEVPHRCKLIHSMAFYASASVSWCLFLNFPFCIFIHTDGMQ